MTGRDIEQRFDDNRVKLREYLEEKIKSLRQLQDLRLDAMDNAVKLAANEMTRRLDTMNRIREDLDSQVDTFITKAEYHDAVNSLRLNVEDLKLSRATLAGKASTNAAIAVGALAFLSLAVGIIALFR